MALLGFAEQVGVVVVTITEAHRIWHAHRRRNQIFMIG
jgi:hypothetical protein